MYVNITTIAKNTTQKLSRPQAGPQHIYMNLASSSGTNHWYKLVMTSLFSAPSGTEHWSLPDHRVGSNPCWRFVCVQVGEGISVNLVNKLTQSEIYDVR